MVYLYELALALDVRSQDLADAAAHRGMTGLTTASKLDVTEARMLQALVFELGWAGIAELAGRAPGPLDAGRLGVEHVVPSEVAVPEGRLRRVGRRRRRRRAA